jgi:hypothetical protein
MLDVPEAYVFPGFPNEIYPPFDDPSYWNRGLNPRFVLSDQVRAWKRNVIECGKFLWLQSSVFVGVFSILAMSQNSKKIPARLAKMWHLWLPVLAAILIYITVHWEDRYLAPFVAMGWSPFVSLIRLPDNTSSRRLMNSAVALVVSILILQTGAITIANALRQHREVERSVRIAEGLYAAGIRPNDKIVEVNGYVNLWEWLVPVSVVGEISREYPAEFLPLSSDKQSLIYERLSSTGARALVSDSVPRWAQNSDWKEIRNTSTYFLYLDQQR